MPPGTLQLASVQPTPIVMNAELLSTGVSVEQAFDRVASKAYEAAVVRGASPIVRPALSCMSAVTDRGICFADAAEDRVRPA